MLISNLPNNRSKKLAWMSQDWPWWLIHTDLFFDCYPVVAIDQPIFKNMATNFGNNKNEQCQQGPPNS
tara:strand:+ start:389 stop:592 length:204 start_codon:yes stop_codon:yes gene_type:complete